MAIACVWLLCVLLLGFIALILRSQTLTYVFVVGLLVSILGQGAELWRMRDQLDDRLRALTDSWDDLKPTMKNQLQILGNCCGYYDLMDRPGSVCPSRASTGCRYRMRETGLYVYRRASDMFGVFVVVCAIMIVLLLLITRKSRISKVIDGAQDTAPPAGYVI